MNEFDIKAAIWDLNPMHFERSKAVASQIIERIPLKSSMTAVEYGEGFTGHRGFDPVLLSDMIRMKGFGDIEVRRCFSIIKIATEIPNRNFDVFLLTAQKPE